jgi:hypothetical protein
MVCYQFKIIKNQQYGIKNLKIMIRIQMMMINEGIEDQVFKCFLIDR